jgi:hypothetical protein
VMDSQERRQNASLELVVRDGQPLGAVTRGCALPVLGRTSNLQTPTNHINRS